LILPFQDSLTPMMPPRGMEEAAYQPFPPDLPTIVGKRALPKLPRWISTTLKVLRMKWR
jgi:hypothetical protein